MVSVDELCTEMAAAGYSLTPRAARDWWTKGLLPRPVRRGLGRGAGTETFWANRRVVEQAKAAHELLTRHSRTHTALIGLWLWGFPVDLARVRHSYLKLIDRHIAWIDRQSPYGDIGDFLGKLATTAARRTVNSTRPAKDRHEVTDLLLAGLSNFYGVNEDLPAAGFEALWATTPSRIAQEEVTRRTDLAVLARYMRRRLHGWGSLPRQREALLTARDHELSRARRVIHIAFGCCVHLAPTEPQRLAEEIGRGALIGLGRPMLLILVSALREPLGQRIVRFLLQFAPAARRGCPIRNQL